MVVVVGGWWKVVGCVGWLWLVVVVVMVVMIGGG